MSNKLLPQEIHLLAMKWASPEHFSKDESVGPLEWRKVYKQRLEQTIADWLAKGLVAYQYPQSRIDAFVPISHLVGTSRNSISYVDSLVEIASELETVRDPRYRPHPREAFPEDDYVLLGECFAGGIAKSIEILAYRLSEEDSEQEPCFQALSDSLSLMQAVKPHNAGSALYAAWSALHGKAINHFNDTAEKHPWVIEHAFALACYPVCNVAASFEVKAVIDSLETAIRRRRAPAVLSLDLKACRNLLSIGKQTSIEKIPSAPVVRSTELESFPLAAIMSRYSNGNKLLPRYQYAYVGGCHA